MAAAGAFTIVVLLSAGSFQAALPDADAKPSPVFADSAAGVKDFVGWLRPQIPTGRWNPPPTQVCVVGAVPFDDAHAPYLPQPLVRSEGPLHGLEPYAATFHYVNADEAKKRARKRTLTTALKICQRGES